MKIIILACGLLLWSWVAVAENLPAQSTPPAVGTDSAKERLGSSVVSEPAPRMLDIRISPIGLLFGVFGAELDVGIWRGFAIGPAFSMLRGLSGATDSTYYQAGGSVSYFLTGERFTTSPFIRTSGYYLPVAINQRSGGQVYAGSLGNYALALRGGYEWIWEHGFNVNLGAGVSYLHTQGRVPTTSATSGTSASFRTPNSTGFQPLLEVSVGWAI